MQEPTQNPTRRDVDFEVAGERIAAWQYEPDAEPPFPCIVMATGFGGTRDMGLPVYAERFRAAGFAVVLFDYRRFGASGGEPRQLLDVGDQLDDWRTALQFVRRDARFDAHRIGLWGTSFSGGHVLTLAAEDHEIAGVVAQVPHVSGITSLTAIHPLSAVKVLGAGIVDALRALADRSPHYISITGHPGENAALTADDAADGYQQLVPEGATFDNRVAARIALSVAFYRPIAGAGRIRCPVLIQAADYDRVTPARAARRTAAKIRSGAYRGFPCSHFDFYKEPWLSQVLDAQVEFFERTLA